MSLDQVFYHGTSLTNARKILRDGFKKPRKGSYTGSGVNLSGSITVSYEYGEYENRGCVLQVSLAPNTNWVNPEFSAGEMLREGKGLDAFFKSTGLDAVCMYGGNVWVVWNLNVITNIRMLDHEEAVARLLNEFEDDGSDCAYNGVAGDYAELYWNDIRKGSCLEDPVWRSQLEKTMATAKAIKTIPVFTGHSNGSAIAAP